MNINHQPQSFDQKSGKTHVKKQKNKQENN
jgi:hypothetical protein